MKIAIFKNYKQIYLNNSHLKSLEWTGVLSELDLSI